MTSSVGEVSPAIGWPLKPYHWYDVALPPVTLLVRWTLLPAQTIAAPPEIVTVVGSLLTATGALTLLQPAPVVTVTLYEPGSETVIDWVVAPFDHE